MSVEDKLVFDYMAILRGLPLGMKLKLLAQLSENIAVEFSQAKEDKTDSWKELFGVWKDMDDDIVEKIRAARFPNRDVPSFD